MTPAPAATAGFSPLDEQRELGEECWSPAVTKVRVWLSGLVGSDRAVAQMLCDVGGINMSRARIWRQTQVWGETFRAEAEAERERAKALPERWEPPSRAEVSDRRMGVALDGALMHIKC